MRQAYDDNHLNPTPKSSHLKLDKPWFTDGHFPPIQLNDTEMQNIRPEVTETEKGAGRKYQNTKDIKEELDQKISQSATEGDSDKAQANTKKQTTEECCDGIKHVPDSECRNEKSEVGEAVYLNGPEQDTPEAENESDNRYLIIDANEEENLGLPKKASEIINEALYWRRKIEGEEVAGALACSKQTEINKLNDDVFVNDCRKIKHSSTKDEDHLRRLAAKIIIQKVYDRVRCYENYIRRADWADEPSSPPRDLVTIPVAYSFAGPYEKVENLYDKTGDFLRHH